MFFSFSRILSLREKGQSGRWNSVRIGAPDVERSVGLSHLSHAGHAIWTWTGGYRKGSVDDSHGAAVLGPGRLVGSDCDRPLLAIGDRLESLRRHAQRHQRRLGRVGSPLAERQIVLSRPALVTMPLDGE